MVPMDMRPPKPRPKPAMRTEVHSYTPKGNDVGVSEAPFEDDDGWDIDIETNAGES